MLQLLFICIRNPFLHSLHILLVRIGLHQPLQIVPDRFDHRARSLLKMHLMSGARAMLEMRCIHMSELWEEFTAFRIQRESRRLYPGFAANDADFNLYHCN
jgi:hypothetical protein